MKTRSQSAWITTADMAKELGLTPKTLLRYRCNLAEGTHYYVVNPSGDRPTYRWNKKRMFRKCGINP